MRHIGVTAAACFLAAALSAQALNPSYTDYIARYRDLAIEQQRKYRVPAAITMAQGILESAAGKSELAVKANNHFGVKCTSDWPGRTYHHDDEVAGECFRRYADVRDSYEDHSLFLLRKRYASLFTLPVGDYRNWAYGLKACGYATDPGYPEKLIRLIELYNLQDLTFDTVLVASGAVSVADTAFHTDAAAAFADASEDGYGSTVMDEVALYRSYRTGHRNGVRYIVAGAGDTFASIADYLNMYERTLRRYNDALDTREPEEGDLIYIYPKKARADRRHAFYYVKPGDTAWGIAQKFGITLKSLYKMNGIPYGTPLTTQQRLKIR